MAPTAPPSAALNPAAGLPAPAVDKALVIVPLFGLEVPAGSLEVGVMLVNKLEEDKPG
jgi:hypothetical protein